MKINNLLGILMTSILMMALFTSAETAPENENSHNKNYYINFDSLNEEETEQLKNMGIYAFR